MSTPKLPLLVRKNIRDDYAGKKEELAKSFKKIFGEDYDFDVDFPVLFAQADEGYQQDNIGSLVYGALEDCSRVIQSDTSTGDNKLLIDGFNEAVSKRSITVVADPNFGGYYCGCRVTDGVFEIIFQPKGLDTNSYSACEHWKKAINEASSRANPKGLPPTAKFGIKKDFDDEIGALQKKMSKHLGGEKLTCHVDFEDMWAKIVDARESLPENKKDDLNLDHLAQRLGAFTLEYFNSLLDKLERELQGDDLMIEGFFDEVSAKEAWFGLVVESESLKNSYTDTTIEEGKLWSKAKPTTFAINVDTGFEGFAKLL